MPAAADAEQSSSKVAEQSDAASVRHSKSPAMSLDKDISNAADDVENAVTGKAAASPSQAPPSTETPMPALHETPSNPETVGDDDESQPITSDDASDVAMAESDDSSSSEQEPEDDYEPAENVVPAVAAKSPSISPVAADSAVSLVNSDTDSQQTSARASQIPEQISLGVNESTPEQGVNAVREVHFVLRQGSASITNLIARPRLLHRALMRHHRLENASPLTRVHCSIFVLTDTIPSLLKPSLAGFGPSPTATGLIRTCPSVQTS